MEVRRILMTTDTVGGVWTFTRELAAQLSRRGKEVVLAALGGTPSEAQVDEVAILPGVYLLPSQFRLEWMENPWEDVHDSGRWLLDVEREYGPDVVHLNSFAHGALPWQHPVVLTAHSCVLSWWRAVHGECAPESWNRYGELVTASLDAAKAVTAPSQAMAGMLTENYRFAAERCKVIWNGRAFKGRSTLKEPLIFSAGRLWDGAKNTAALAEVASSLPWPVYLAGDAPEGQLSTCRILGKLNATQMEDWYARAAIYALPAKYEPFGLSVLEAALAGCALVLGDIPSLRELWAGSALFVPPDDCDALRRALAELIDNPAHREQLARMSYERALRYTPARMADEYQAVYQNIRQQRRQPCAT